jgi:transposase
LTNTNDVLLFPYQNKIKSVGGNMPAKLYNVCLTDEQVQYLFDIVYNGKHETRKITRARILLLSSSGETDEEIVLALQTSLSTVRRVRIRFAKEGLTAALEEKPRPGQPVKLSGSDEALLTAIACSEAPEGRSRWTLRLLADKLVELKVVPSISHVTIFNILKKTT